jgi:hypothetical protein
MAIDVGRIANNLCRFYDFRNKRVIAVGAGMGAIFEYAQQARFVIAVDRNEDTIDHLVDRVREERLANRFFMIVGDLRSVHHHSDVVLFEFSLHDIADSRGALDHAHALAPEILVIDHAPGSPWSWFASEEQGVADCWAVVSQTTIRRQTNVDAVQRFDDFQQLERRMRHQGPTSQARIEEFLNVTPIAIPMPYRLALLDSNRAGSPNGSSPLKS